MASPPDVSPRPFSVAEYHRMADAGILTEDDRVELLEGVIVLMSPQNEPHAHAIEVLNETLVMQVTGRYRVRPQLPLTIDDRSEPEPDLAVLPIPQAGAPVLNRRDALLVIEVASDSLRKDRLVKSRIYARAGIPEYWIVNVEERCVEVSRDPDPAAGVYRVSAKASPGEDLRSSAVDGVVVVVAELFA
jgi:Uma2 family endonuclease